MRKLRMHIAQMVSQCDYLNVCSRESVTGGQGTALPGTKMAKMIARKCLQPLPSVYRLCRQRQWQEVFSWLVILLSLWVPGYAQDTPEVSAPVPVLASPPPSSQERLLSPVPTQFDWIQRQVRPNPLMEALLTLRGSPSRLFLSATLSEEYSDNFSEARWRWRWARGIPDDSRHWHGLSSGKRPEFCVAGQFSQRQLSSPCREQ